MSNEGRIVTAAQMFEEQQEENIRLKVQLDTALAEIARTRTTIEHLAEVVSDACDAAAARGRGGQQVSFHGDFCNAAPSVLVRLEWWIRALKGKP